MENQIQTETNVSENSFAPAEVDNAEDTKETPVSITKPAENVTQVSSAQEVGQSQKDPKSELILGKFKSVEDLSKAYEELQKQQGSSSQELGELRKVSSKINEAKSFMDSYKTYYEEARNFIREAKEKYNSPEYFQNSAFEEIFYEALEGFGHYNLDMDKFVSLIDEYVSLRIEAHEKKNSATSETQKILDSMGYNKNSKNSLTPPKKRLNEMTPQEIDDMLDRLI